MFCNQGKYLLQHPLLQNNVSFPHFFPPPYCQLHCTRRNCKASNSSWTRQLRVLGCKSASHLSGKLGLLGNSRLSGGKISSSHCCQKQPRVVQSLYKLAYCCCPLTGSVCVQFACVLDITCGIWILACFPQTCQTVFGPVSYEENSLVLKFSLKLILNTVIFMVVGPVVCLF